VIGIADRGIQLGQVVPVFGHLGGEPANPSLQRRDVHLLLR
jgi:hypothetical protein